MSERPPLARAATERLARDDSEPRAPSPEAREKAIASIAAAIEGASRARRRRRFAYGALAVAAAAAVTVSVRSFVRTPTAQAPSQPGVVAHGGGGVTLSHGGTTAPLLDAVELAGGDRIRTAPGASASLALSTGTQVEIQGGSELALVSKDGDQVFAVEAGATRFVVAKVPDGKRFVVRTADAEVEVRGTAFRVAVVGEEASCDGSATRVDVTEGAVVVRRAGKEWRVAANESWPAGCATSAAASVATTPEPAKPAPKLPGHAHASAAVASSSAAAVAHASDLSAQNDLFAEATSKLRNGDRVGALSAFERYLARWPGGALAESAAIERMRLLGGAAAREAAKAYLARWPKGSARAEAEAILAKP